MNSVYRVRYLQSITPTSLGYRGIKPPRRSQLYFVSLHGTPLCAISPHSNYLKGGACVDVISALADVVRHDCSFELDMCSWENRTDDQREWTRGRGNTPTPNTGPSQDHTSGESRVEVNVEIFPL